MTSSHLPSDSLFEACRHCGAKAGEAHYSTCRYGAAAQPESCCGSRASMVVPATEDDALRMIDAATERLVADGWKPSEIGRRCRESAAQIVAANDPRLSLDLTEFGQ